MRQATMRRASNPGAWEARPLPFPHSVATAAMASPTSNHRSRTLPPVPLLRRQQDTPLRLQPSRLRRPRHDGVVAGLRPAVLSPDGVRNGPRPAGFLLPGAAIEPACFWVRDSCSANRSSNPGGTVPPEDTGNEPPPRSAISNQTST